MKIAREFRRSWDWLQPGRWPLVTTVIFALGVSLCSAAVTPLSWPSQGIGPLTFDEEPDLQHGWSTRVVAGRNSDIGSAAGTAAQNQAQMDAAVQTNRASEIVNPLQIDTSGVTPHTVSYSGAFRWNSARHFLESRPTGVAYSELLLTLRNNAGFDQSFLALDYDFGVDLPAGFQDSEDPGLFGYRVYYSLSGETNTWVHLPDLDTSSELGSGAKHAVMHFSEPWEVGANLYILWVDDNGPIGNATASPTEGPYTIDNVTLGPDDSCLSVRIFFTTQPHDVTVEQCRATNFLTLLMGTGSINYQWFRNSLSAPIPGATNGALNFPNSQPSDSGVYFMRATTPCGPMESRHATLTVNADVDQPTVICALPTFDRTNVVVTFSEKMDIPSLQSSSSYRLRSPGGGEVFTATAARASSNGTAVTVSFDLPNDTQGGYDLLIAPGVADCVGNPLIGVSGPDETVVVSLQCGLSISYAGSQAHITWSDPEAVLYQNDSLDPAPESWKRLTSGGSAVVPVSAPQQFYLLRR